MLFDLRGRGRRRTVQVIYLSLAILMGGGLVLFGIGGATSGGLVDALNSNSGSDVQDIYGDRVEALEKKTAAEPGNAQAWADLARARFQQATTGEGFDQSSGTFTDKGKQQLAGVKAAWEKHTALAKDDVDPNTARLMIQAFGQSGLNDNGAAVAAMEDVIAGTEDPTYQLYAQYAILAYTAGQNRKGDLAKKEALALAPKDEREALTSQIDSAKTQIGVDSEGQLTTTTG